MPTWGHKRMVWHPAAVLWPASVELYSNTVSISQYKYDSPPLHIRTSCIESVHTHLPIRGPSQAYSAVCSAVLYLGHLNMSSGLTRERERESDQTFYLGASVISGRERLCQRVSHSVTRSLGKKWLTWSLYLSMSHDIPLITIISLK